MMHTAKASRLRSLLENSLLRDGLRELGCGAVAFALSPAAAGNLPLPLCVGFLLSLDSGGALSACLGCALGAVLFWQEQAFAELLAGTVAALFALALFTGRRPVWLPAVLAGSVTGSIGLIFLLAAPGHAASELWGLLLQTAASAGAAAAFRMGQEGRCRAVTAGMLCLGLCRIPLGVLNPGILCAAFLAAKTGQLPAALLCGLGVDLAGVTAVSVAPALCLGLLPLGLPRQKAKLLTGLWSLPVMYIAGLFDPAVFLAMNLGGLLAFPFPVKRQETPPEPGPPGASERLEIAAGAMDYVGEQLGQIDLPILDHRILAERAMQRACLRCSRAEACAQRLQIRGNLEDAAAELLSGGLEALPPLCPESGRLADAMDSALRDYRLLRQFHRRRADGLAALCRQYRTLSAYLRTTAHAMEQPLMPAVPRYRVELGYASRGKFGNLANGDRGAHFPGPGQTYFVLLCDGMGAGVGAAREAESALHLLTGMLRSGLPPDTAMETLNDLYVLRETGGFSTADLLELHLDTGRARLYKWGACPSYLKYRTSVRLLGSASPPPGISVASERGPETLSLNLRRGEMLVLVSDGLAVPETRERIAAFPMPSPKRLTEELLADTDALRDDCTAIAVRLSPWAPKE